MKKIKQHFNLLGMTAEDKITGFKGIVSSISFDLYGCIQAILTPPIDKDGKPQEGRWFDVPRLKIIDEKPVMDVPDWDFDYMADGRKGAAEKPYSERY